MDNYLSHRWPDGTGRPGPAAPRPAPRRRKRRVGRTLLALAAGALALTLLTVGAYWGAFRLAEYYTAQAGGAEPSADLPRPSSLIPQGESAWTSADFPWGEPDPSVQLLLDQADGRELRPQELYRKVLPSIVCVEAESSQGYSVGSGVIMSASGYIITNYHVIEKSISIEVMLLSDQSYYEAVVIGFDEELDIAILKVDADDLVPAVFGDSDQLQVGDPVYAIGNPMGYLYGTMTDGIVSSLARQVEVGDLNMTMIQTTAALNSGNSGGALVDACGRVVGITVAKITGVEDDVVTEGIGLAIPVTDALPFINHILSTGSSFRPALGIICYSDLTSDPQGIRVKEVTAGTPAMGRLKPDDLIISANGVRVIALNDLTRVLYTSGVGGEVELTVLRGGKTISVTITLYDRLADE